MARFNIRETKKMDGNANGRDLCKRRCSRKQLKQNNQSQVGINKAGRESGKFLIHTKQQQQQQQLRFQVLSWFRDPLGSPGLPGCCRFFYFSLTCLLPHNYEICIH